MLKQLTLLFLLSTAACAQAVSINDIVAATKNLLEQPGNTFADAALFITCTGATNMLLTLCDPRGTNYLKKVNNPIFFIGTSLRFIPTTLIIKGMPSYKFLGSVFVPTIMTLRYQRIESALTSLTPLAVGYAGLLIKNLITHAQR